MAVNAAAQDTRIKATAAMTMYDMTRVNANGYFDSENNADARYAKKQAMNAQRTKDYFSEGVYEKLTGENKELLIIPGTNHTDLYDRMDVIPFDKLDAFFRDNLG